MRYFNIISYSNAVFLHILVCCYSKPNSTNQINILISWNLVDLKPTKIISCIVNANCVVRMWCWNDAYYLITNQWCSIICGEIMFRRYNCILWFPFVMCNMNRYIFFFIGLISIFPQQFWRYRRCKYFSQTKNCWNMANLTENVAKSFRFIIMNFHQIWLHHQNIIMLFFVS